MCKVIWREGHLEHIIRLATTPISSGAMLIVRESALALLSAIAVTSLGATGLLELHVVEALTAAVTSSGEEMSDLPTETTGSESQLCVRAVRQTCLVLVSMLGSLPNHHGLIPSILRWVSPMDIGMVLLVRRNEHFMN